MWVQLATTRRLAAMGVPPALWPRPQMGSYLPGLVGVVLFLPDAYKIVRGLAFVRRGTVAVAATPAGLRYRNAPAWRGAGHVARQDLDGLGVRLEDALQRAADALADALGIRPAPATA